jgi:phospholipase D1/2
MSLWAEHFGGNLNPVFEDPGSLECLRLFNQKAEENWKKYAEAKVANMEAHIMAYPILVGKDGSVGDLPKGEKFLGERAKVKGSSVGPAWFSSFTV